MHTGHAAPRFIHAVMCASFPGARPELSRPLEGAGPQMGKWASSALGRQRSFSCRNLAQPHRAAAQLRPADARSLSFRPSLLCWKTTTPLQTSVNSSARYGIAELGLHPHDRAGWHRKAGNPGPPAWARVPDAGRGRAGHVSLGLQPLCHTGDKLEQGPSPGVRDKHLGFLWNKSLAVLGSSLQRFSGLLTSVLGYS